MSARPTATIADLPLSSAALDRLSDAGRRVAFWWRDDDARRPTPELERLLALAKDHDVPLALAVIPEGAEPALAERLSREPHVSVLLHGFSHANHAPEGEKRAEFGDHRPAEAMAGEITAGKSKLEGLFGNSFHPVFVPPWNRIGPSARTLLPHLGLPIVSTYGPAKARGEGMPAEHNTHLDIMDWRAMRGLAIDEADRLLAAQIDENRAGETIGILTHHLQHDEAAWALANRLLGLLAAHPAAGWKAAL
ncbi:polysaccharide deacetylase family protein [Jiella mangrovi]|uniref:Polysaccharide deacetylase family protein n=1 Tax=Jiella mangrovi TaxID=2821407 RepID=A0ABS4BKZ0_9HYPH|nr:polysaccharide deacetylase family protein [Jiella mangrovi]MBP0617384.1 polysaccharide deacetylase family protein [Jiella mangrovi]